MRKRATSGRDGNLEADVLDRRRLRRADRNGEFDVAVEVHLGGRVHHQRSGSRPSPATPPRRGLFVKVTPPPFHASRSARRSARRGHGARQQLPPARRGAVISSREAALDLIRGSPARSARPSGRARRRSAADVTGVYGFTSWSSTAIVELSTKAREPPRLVVSVSRGMTVDRHANRHGHRRRRRALRGDRRGACICRPRGALPPPARRTRAPGRALRHRRERGRTARAGRITPPRLMQVNAEAAMLPPPFRFIAAEGNLDVGQILPSRVHPQLERGRTRRDGVAP